MLKSGKIWPKFRQFISKARSANGTIGSSAGMMHLQNFDFVLHRSMSGENKRKLPVETDILVIGGGAMGSSIAYWLKAEAGENKRVVVVERDSTYANASTCLSVGGVRQQFSLSENIEMSLFGAEFIQNIHKYLSVETSNPPDVNFQSHGYLFLASSKGADLLESNSALQRQYGAQNVLLSPEKLRERFPWLNTNGIELGCYGLSNEGWFDPWSLLNAFKQKNLSLKCEYVEGQVIGLECGRSGSEQVVNSVLVRQPAASGGHVINIKCGTCVLAAGANSGQVATMAGIGVAEGVLGVCLPIEPRKRFVFCYHCPEGPPYNTPLVIDPSGTYFRPEGRGGKFLAGCSPASHEEPSVENLDVDYTFFDERVWPALSQRVASFEKLKLTNGWAGYYEMNTLDGNAVIGRHPVYENLVIASGFSGHGIQHSPAVGRAVMELIIHGRYKTIDLSRLGYQRLCRGEPLLETNIV